MCICFLSVSINVNRHGYQLEQSPAASIMPFNFILEESYGSLFLLK